MNLLNLKKQVRIDANPSRDAWQTRLIDENERFLTTNLANRHESESGEIRRILNFLISED